MLMVFVSYTGFHIQPTYMVSISVQSIMTRVLGYFLNVCGNFLVTSCLDGQVTSVSLRLEERKHTHVVTIRLTWVSEIENISPSCSQSVQAVI